MRIQNTDNKDLFFVKDTNQYIKKVYFSNIVRQQLILKSANQ